MTKFSSNLFLTILPQISTLLYNKWIDKTLNMNKWKVCKQIYYNAKKTPV